VVVIPPEILYSSKGANGAKIVLIALLLTLHPLARSRALVIPEGPFVLQRMMRAAGMTRGRLIPYIVGGVVAVLLVQGAIVAAVVLLVVVVVVIVVGCVDAKLFGGFHNSFNFRHGWGVGRGRRKEEEGGGR